MAIAGMEGMTQQQVQFELQRGAKVVRYTYCISMLIITFKRSSIHFIKPEDSRISKGMPWTLLSLVAGWWGIPWGPIWTVQALITNLRGGKDITAEIFNVSALSQSASAGTMR